MASDAGVSTRTAILDAAEQILRTDGYAKVSSRRIGLAAGLKSQLIHYHFSSMDALFLALFQRVEEDHFQRLAEAIASRAPLRSLWAVSIDSSGPRLTKEFIALASHRPQLRQEIARSAERTRSIFCAALSQAMQRRGLLEEGSPMALAVLMDGAARVILSDRAMGSASGHAETIAFVERQITRLEG